MNLWTLERMRFTRTGRWVPIVAVFGFFGLTSPLIAKFQQQLFRRAGGNIRIIVPPPTPADGIRGFVGNAQQLGLLAVIIIAAGAFAFDAKPEMAMFFRTRVRRASLLVAPKFVANAVAAVAGYAVGVAAAWILTAILIGALPAGAVLEGTALWVVYLAFAVSMVAFASGLIRSQLAVVLVSLGSLIVLAVAGQLGGVGSWLPTELAGSPDALLSGRSLSHFVPSLLVTAGLTPVLLGAASRLLDRREL